MTRRIVVLRPEPGNAATCARIRDAGGTAAAMPLFEVAALPWATVDPADFDALLLTSANAARHAGAGLQALAKLPAVVVGKATAAAARAAGLAVAGVGSDDARSALAELQRLGFARALHLCGRDHLIGRGGAITAVVPVYASIALAAPAALLPGDVALVHSPRAARRLAEIAPDRSRIAVVAISGNAAEALGTGWAAVTIAERPDDEALVTAALVAAAAAVH